MGAFGERSIEEGGKGSVRASGSSGGVEGGEVDSKGRRPIILGGKEESIVLASLFFTMCEYEPAFRSSTGWEGRESSAGRGGSRELRETSVLC